MKDDRLLRWALAVTVAVPALTVVWWTRGGDVTLVMYREPKLAAVQILGWSLLVLLVWRRAKDVDVLLGADQLKKPTTALTALFVAFLAFSGLWAEVTESYLYEIFQYLLLLLLFFALRAWASTDTRLRVTLLWSLAASLGVATLIGIVQLFVFIPQLSPINPDLGVAHPSVMGYKNPMALSLTGQVYLLAFLVFRRAGSTAARLLGATILAAELFYLATLESRSAYTALLLSAPPFLFLLLLCAYRQRRLLRVAAAVLVLGGVFLGALLASPDSRRRLQTIQDYIGDPFYYLESDRSTYALNTLNMVAERPFGVGLGNWQTFYPVYRAHARYTTFSDSVQVRRAHSDHVQFLGETGWQGLALWLSLLLVYVVHAFRRYRLESDPFFLFAGFQLCAITIAAMFDYYVEIPYNKFQFFLVLALIAAEPGDAASVPRRRAVHATVFHNPVRVAVTLLGAVCTLYSANLFVKSFHATQLREIYARLLPAVEGGEEALMARLVESAAIPGRRFERLVGHDKTFHKDYLILAHIAFLQGDTARAVSMIARSLDLHPYDPNAFRLLASVMWQTDRDQAEIYLDTSTYIMHQARRGFERPYPRLPAP